MNEGIKEVKEILWQKWGKKKPIGHLHYYGA
jgi:hypothetical protein